MKKSYQRLAFCGFLLGLGLPASAAGSPGATAANFLNIDLGPRPVALGGAFTGLADDINAIAYNPAGLGVLRRQELTFMHNEYFEGVRQDWVAYALPTRALGTFAASANVLYVEPIATFDEFDRPAGKVTAADSAFTLAYANKLGDSLTWGVGSKYIRSYLDSYSAEAAAFDLGLRYQPWSGLSAGFAVLNLGTRMRFIDESFELPLTYRGGLALALLRDPASGRELNFASDVVAPRGQDPYIAGGVEYVQSGILILRAGGRSGQDTGLGYTVGIGLRLFRGHPTAPEVSFDYAVVDFGELSLSHRASLSIRWGGYGPEQPRERPSSAAPEEIVGVEEHFARADGFIDRKQYKKAQAELEAAAETLGPEDRRRVRYSERMGEIAYRQGDHKAAYESYVEALRLAGSLGIRDASVADAYAGMGLCLAEKGNIAYAIKFFKKGLEVGPSTDTRRLIEAQLKQLRNKPEGDKP